MQAQLADEFCSQFVGLAAGGAVADGDQRHLVFVAQQRQLVQSAVPVAAWLVREHGGGFHQLASSVHHGHFHTGADARVQAHHHARTRRGSQQQITQVVGKHLDGYFFSAFAQAGYQVTLQRQAELDAPGPGQCFANECIRRAVKVPPVD